MNRTTCRGALSVALLGIILLAAGTRGQEAKTGSGEEFFIIASMDQSKSQLLLKRPTEVTMLVKATDKTQYSDENGKPLHLSDLRAGDTVWVVSSKSGSSDGPTAIRVRKGPMTLTELHKYYLDYPEIK